MAAGPPGDPDTCLLAGLLPCARVVPDVTCSSGGPVRAHRGARGGTGWRYGHVSAWLGSGPAIACTADEPDRGRSHGRAVGSRKWQEAEGIEATRRCAQPGGDRMSVGREL